MSDESSETEKPDSGTKLESGHTNAEVKAPETSELPNDQDEAPGLDEAQKGDQPATTAVASANEQSNTTAGETPAAADSTSEKTTSPSTASAPKVTPAKNAVPAKGSALGRFWWVLASFILPFSILLLYLTGQSAVSWKLCVRSGFVGLGAALIIYGLWKIDNKISGSRNLDVSSQLLVRMLGMMLWLVWVGASHVMLLATDEIFPPLDLS